jgi:1-acyl-sn-glycerol-3-phosphate acyltransferase
LALALSGTLGAVPRAYHRLCCRIFGMNVVVRGTPSPTHPTLFVSNHSSYFDIDRPGVAVQLFLHRQVGHDHLAAGRQAGEAAAQRLRRPQAGQCRRA